MLLVHSSMQKQRGLKDRLFLHVVPKMLIKRKDALVVSGLDSESEDLSSFPNSATDLPGTLGEITQLP